MLTIKVNTTHSWDITADEIANLDLLNRENRHFHLLLGNKSIEVDLVEADYAAKTFQFLINGRTYAVQGEDAFDKLMKELGMSANAAKKVNHLKAPMPGLILAVQVEEGQTVKKGDTLLILEAMKMENSIKAPNDGIIAHIPIQKGQTVDKGQLLMEMK
jgi:biotin carboxyl carrier protein